MKRRTTSTLIISIPKLDISCIESIDFVFKSIRSEDAKAIIKKTYPDDVTYDEANNIFLMPFTQEETLLFNCSKVYMDSRPVTTGGKVLPTSIVTVDIQATLFGDADI